MPNQSVPPAAQGAFRATLLTIRDLRHPREVAAGSIYTDIAPFFEGIYTFLMSFQGPQQHSDRGATQRQDNHGCFDYWTGSTKRIAEFFLEEKIVTFLNSKYDPKKPEESVSDEPFMSFLDLILPAVIATDLQMASSDYEALSETRTELESTVTQMETILNNTDGSAGSASSDLNSEDGDDREVLQKFKERLEKVTINLRRQEHVRELLQIFCDLREAVCALQGKHRDFAKQHIHWASTGVDRIDQEEHDKVYMPFEEMARRIDNLFDKLLASIIGKEPTPQPYNTQFKMLISTVIAYLCLFWMKDGPGFLYCDPINDCKTYRSIFKDKWMRLQSHVKSRDEDIKKSFGLDKGDKLLAEYKEVRDRLFKHALQSIQNMPANAEDDILSRDPQSVIGSTPLAQVTEYLTGIVPE
ncbi:hypothetical protein BJ508DRAFT_381175 [Ascobolus immersus RN42]|uniref:Uncharacterized protein n=1 Tax=Ascobolus immersus RN42 TaxID=1160509 RepID=A0A3N4HGN7_ASCIM|nr:hypothetical protein BJ508DRAFT_381175 [Ascobolus immersus RN42]